MPEKTLNQRLIIIGVVLLAGLWLVVPPSQKLKPGLDIAGGFSLIFEIDTAGVEGNQNIAEDMKELLRRRVDPSGVYELIWRVHGRNRIEVQMPLPRKEAVELREQFLAAQEKLFQSAIKPGELDVLFATPPAERDAALVAHSGGSEARLKVLRDTAVVFDEYQAARAAREAGPPPAPATSASTEPSTLPAPITMERLRLEERNATQRYLNAIELVLATNLNRAQFDEILDSDPDSTKRKNDLDTLKSNHPELKALIEEVVAKHDAWRKTRSFLDGPADLRRLLRGSGVMEFRILAEPGGDPAAYDAMRNALRERGPVASRTETYGWFKIDNPVAFFNLKSAAELARYDLRANPLYVAEKLNNDYFVLGKTDRAHGLLRPGPGERKWQLKQAAVDRDERGRLCVLFGLDAYGGDRFRELTSANVNKQLCTLMDDVAYSSANIAEAIGASGRITGDFNAEKVTYLVQSMQAGALPARLKETPISERTIGSSLGEENLRSAFYSGVVGVGVVIAFIAVYYLRAGLIANAALLMNVLLVLATMSLLQARFSLAGIAGVILTIGMSIDANVLIFERMREERARGASLRMMIKNGYDKALSTIIDANITTLLTCLIIYYVGSEEIRGFGLTLGWGLATSLFTSLFVTRTAFALLVKYNLIRDIRFMQFIGVPTIDWWGLRKYFIPTSVIVTVVGVGLLVARGARDTLDVEFLGGISAEVELKKPGSMNDRQIAEKLAAIGDQISKDAAKLSAATVEPHAGATDSFDVRIPDLAGPRAVAFLTEPLEEAGLMARSPQDPGIRLAADGAAVVIRAKDGVKQEDLKARIQSLASLTAADGENIRRANVTAVTETSGAAEKGRYWGVTTTVTNKLLVQHALVTAVGDSLQIQPQVSYIVRGDDGRPYPITERRLESVIPGLPAGAGGDVSAHRGGAALWFDQVQPAQTLEAVRDRLRNMRLQPGYEDYPWREFELVGVAPADANGDGQGDVLDGKALFSGFVVLVSDEKVQYDDNPQLWAEKLANPELELARATLDTEQSLRKVSQFKPQVATQAVVRASIAIILAWLMIIAYVWVRFGKPIYGVAGVIALVHDVLVALSAIGIAGWLGALGRVFLIEDFKIDMTIIAALLTIIGFSINDTIVTFDRIRELRGRLGKVTPEIINLAVNQTMSRTILTAATVFAVLLSMYIFGGPSIRGFNFCMLIGVITGTYSSLAIAAPLLMLGAKDVEEPAPRFGKPATA